MFYKADKFKGYGSNWNTTRATAMFYKANNFNGDVSKWNDASVTDMSR